MKFLEPISLSTAHPSKSLNIRHFKLKNVIMVIGLGLIATALSGCKSSNEPQNHSAWKDITDQGLPIDSRNPNVFISGEKESTTESDTGAPTNDTQDHEDIDEERIVGRVSAVQPVELERNPEIVAVEVKKAIETSQARLAAKSRDVCPKLLTKTVDSNVIMRQNEVMKGDYCDYYLYPEVGDTLVVKSLPDTIHAVLSSPQLHDFNNGGYLVKDSTRHDIRLKYVGNSYRNEPLSYGMSVVIQ